MKHLKITLGIATVLLVVAACARWNSREYTLYPKETSLSFSGSIQHQENLDILEHILWFKFAGFEKHDLNWLRNPKHLWTTYNVLKQIGLEHFVSREAYVKPLYENNHWKYHWQGMRLIEVVEQLRRTYHQQDPDSTSYFHHFWNRRRTDGTATVVMSILTDVAHFYAGQEVLPVNRNTLNDTLFSLLGYNVAFNSSDSTNRADITYAYFSYLKGVGLEHSAYNLLFTLPATADVNLDKKALIEQLETEVVSGAGYDAVYEQASWIADPPKGP